GEVAAREVLVHRRVRVYDDLEVVPSGPGRALQPWRRELDPGTREPADPAVARHQPDANGPARDDEIVDPARGLEQRPQPGEVAARDGEVRVLRAEPGQPAATRAADKVRVEPERRDVLLDRLHDPPRAGSVGQRDRLDLDERARGQLRDLDGRPRRR